MVEKQFEDIILERLSERLSSCIGLIPFVEQGRAIEQWIQVELCGILIENEATKIIPEESSEGKGTDITFQLNGREYAIELKVVIATRKKGTGQRVEGAITSGGTSLKPIYDDIEKLQREKIQKEFDKRMIIFVALPLADENDNSWTKKAHFADIKGQIEGDLKTVKFKFCSSETPSVIFLGYVKRINYN